MKHVASTRAYHRIVYFFTAALVAFAVQVGIAEAATLSLSPNTGVYTTGNTFTTRVVVNTRGSAINAAEATLSFNPSQLAVVSISKGSTFSLWAVEPSYSNSAGTITFGGGSPAGYTGGAGTVLNITWRSKASGPARVSFSNGSVLAADGRGTNIVQSLNGGSYTIASAAVQPEPETIEYVAPANTPGQPIISSATHDSDGWSQQTTARLSWTLPSDVTAVRTLLDANSGSIPTRVYETPISEIELADLESGVQYFHLQFRNAEGWGRVAHYRLAVDTEAPSAFTITRDESIDSSNPNQRLLFNVEDAHSPVLRYVIQHNGGEAYEYIDETGSSSMPVSDLEPGKHSFVIEAFDAAGNGRIATVSFAVDAFEAPQWTEYPTEVRSTVVPVLFGTTRPDATVEVTMQSIDRGTQAPGPIMYTVTADQDGLFRVVPDGRLAEGVYEITAVASDRSGAQSRTSDPIRISVTPPGYIALGQWAVSIMSVVVPLVALLVLLALVVLYGLQRARRIRQVVIRETTDALEVLDTRFAELRETLHEQTAALEKSRKTKKLTKAEQALVDDMQDNIDNAYTAIKKEIAEVDDIVE